MPVRIRDLLEVAHGMAGMDFGSDLVPDLVPAWGDLSDLR